MPKNGGYRDGMMPNTGPKSVRPDAEMAQKPMRQDRMAAKLDMMEKGGPMRPDDPTMASKPMASGDGLGKMALGMGGSRRVRQATGMTETRIPGSS